MTPRPAPEAFENNDPLPLPSRSCGCWRILSGPHHPQLPNPHPHPCLGLRGSGDAFSIPGKKGKASDAMGRSHTEQKIKVGKA